MLPYLDTAGFVRRTVMPAGDVGIVETVVPGFTATRLMVWQSYINARLRKRYGNNLPLGQNPPALVAVGTLPPAVSLQGRPVLGSAQYQIQVTTPGSIPGMVFQWSADNGITWTTGVPGAAIVQLTGLQGNSGIQALFPIAAYSADNQYSAATPVPEAVLGWLVALVTIDLYRKRGVNPQDPTIQMVQDDATRALAELKEAADSDIGLFDLPQSDDLNSAVDTGGPLGYSEASPYKWADKEARHGRREDDEEGQQVDPNNPPGAGIP